MEPPLRPSPAPAPGAERGLGGVNGTGGCCAGLRCCCLWPPFPESILQRFPSRTKAACPCCPPGGGGPGERGGDARGCAQGPMARRSVPEGEHGSLVLGCTCESWAAVGTRGCGQGGCKQPPRGGAGMGEKWGLPQQGWGPGAVPCQQRLWGPHARSSLGSPCQEQFGVPTLTLVPVPGVPLWGGGRAVRVPQAPWLCPKSGPPPRCRCWAQPSATCPLFIRGWRGARGGRGWEAARP